MATKLPKEFAGQIKTLNERLALDSNIQRCTTGSKKLDYILGGGLLEGRLHEFFGKESSGKTSLAMSCMLQVLKKYPEHEVLYVDAEQSLKVDYYYDMMEGYGADRFHIAEPRTGEEAWSYVRWGLENPKIKGIVIDSVAAMWPSKLLDEVGQPEVMGRARLNNQSIGTLNPMLRINRPFLVCINQEREKPGMNGYVTITTPGGTGIPFYSSIRVRVRGKGEIKGPDGTPIGVKTWFRSIKNKTAFPYQETETEFYFGKGYNYEMELIDLALEAGIIERKGAFYSYAPPTGDPISLGRGKEAATEMILGDRDLFKRIEADYDTTAALTKKAADVTDEVGAEG